MSAVSLAAAHRVRVYLLIFWMAVLLSASLYPFDFSAEVWRDRAARLVLDRSLFGHSTRTDLSGNLLAYLPVGMLIGLLLGDRPRWQRVMFGTLTGMLLSAAVEALQLGIAMRFASATDFIANSLSSAAGAGAALWYGAKPGRQGISARLNECLPGAAVPFLLAVWVATQAAPFMPRLRRTRMLDGLADFWQWGLRDGSLLRHTAGLLILSALLRALFRPEWFWASFALAVSGSWLSGIVFVQHQLAAGVFLACLLALPTVGWQQRQGRHAANGPLFWAVTALLLVAALLSADSIATASLSQWLFPLFGALWLGVNSRVLLT